MSYDYVIEQPPGCVVITGTGDATFEVNKILMENVMADPRFVAGLHRLYDLRDQEMPLSREDASKLARYHAQIEDTCGHCKVAILVRLDTGFGRARVYTSFGDTLKADYLVTKDVKEAKAWVGLPADYQLPADL